MAGENDKGGNGAATLTREFVPQEFHDRGYLKDLLDKPWGKDTATEVFKKLDGAESLLGKRPVVPTKDSKPEELEKFFSQYRPEKPEEYEFPMKPEELKTHELFVKNVREALHGANVSKVQAQKFMARMTEYGLESQKAAQAAQARKDAEFDALAKAGLGDKNKDVMARVNKAIREHAPAAFKDQIDRLDDKNLVLMAGVIDAIMQKYVPEDKLKAKPDSSSANGAGDIKAKREEAKTLMGSKAYTNWQDPQHEATVAKVSALYKEIAAAGVTA